MILNKAVSLNKRVNEWPWNGTRRGNHEQKLDYERG